MLVPQPKIVYLTAGGGGMYCGSCMRDNTLAAALTRLGCDIALVPLYTPIRTDEADVSVDKVFFGGINMYLQEKIPLLRHVPRFLDRWLDWPWLIRRVASGRIKVAAKELGELTISVLQGEHGHQRKEVFRLVDWLVNHARPQLVNLSNVLIAGCVPEIKRRCNVPVLVTLQGDDLFLQGLEQPYHDQALAEIRRVGEQVDGFVVFSNYYADFMSEYLDLDRGKFHVVPLGVQLDDFHHQPLPSAAPSTIGYLARICPEKGFHQLVEAFCRLAKQPAHQHTRLRAAGWLGASDEQFFAEQLRRIAAAGLADRFSYEGVLDRRQKVDFLNSVHVFSVPTVYREPKGLYVLEAWASGLPVVQPAHGAFPEMLSQVAGGRLTTPGDVDHLASTLSELLLDGAAQRELGARGRAGVAEFFSAERMARETLALYQRFLQPLAAEVSVASAAAT